MNSLENTRTKYKVVTNDQVSDTNTDIKLVDANMRPFISTDELIKVFAYSVGIEELPSTEIAEDFSHNESIICDNVTITNLVNTILKTSE